MSSHCKYDIDRSYDWNYDNVPSPIDLDIPVVPGTWSFLGLPIDSPLGIAAGPLLNGAWIRYYASLGFDFLTYKTVRSSARECYAVPNLVPVECGQLRGGERDLSQAEQMTGSWAVSFGMPSKEPAVWRRDVEATRDALPKGKLLSVSCVGTVQPDWSIEDLADDYAQCALWALESGADCVETNFSCPNVSTCDGQIFQQADQAGIIAERVRQRIGADARFLVKIGHFMDADDAQRLVQAVAPFVDAIVTTNSVPSTIVDESGDPMFDGQPRGICGRATLQASQLQTKLLVQMTRDFPFSTSVVGVGGIRNAQDVLGYLKAGAVGVQLATEIMIDPLVAVQIRRDLATEVAR